MTNEKIKEYFDYYPEEDVLLVAGNTVFLKRNIGSALNEAYRLKSNVKEIKREDIYNTKSKEPVNTTKKINIVEEEVEDFDDKNTDKNTGKGKSKKTKTNDNKKSKGKAKNKKNIKI